MVLVSAEQFSRWFTDKKKEQLGFKLLLPV
jgi:hypothetical protein